MTETHNSNGTNGTGIRGWIRSRCEAAKNRFLRLKDRIKNHSRKVAEHCAANEKTYAVLVPVSGAVMSLITLILAVVGVLAISNFRAQKDALEAIEFFTPKVKFEDGQAEYDQNKSRVFIHTKMTNIGNLPINAKLHDIVVVTFTVDEKGNYNASKKILIVESDPLADPKISIASKSTLEWPLTFKHELPEYNFDKPFYTCAVAKLTLETFLSNDHKDELDNLGLEYSPEDLKHTKRTTKNLTLQSQGKYGDDKFDRNFCQKNLKEIYKIYQTKLCETQNLASTTEIINNTDIKEKEFILPQWLIDAKEFITSQFSFLSEPKDESPLIALFETNSEYAMSNPPVGACEKSKINNEPIH